MNYLEEMFSKEIMSDLAANEYSSSSLSQKLLVKYYNNVYSHEHYQAFEIAKKIFLLPIF
jgi:hypothetical protein